MEACQSTKCRRMWFETTQWQPIIVAQRTHACCALDRVWLITRRTVDRNNPMIYSEDGHSEGCVRRKSIVRRGIYQTKSLLCNGSIQAASGRGRWIETTQWQPIIVAQRKRVWLITRRTVDRNNPMIYSEDGHSEVCDGYVRWKCLRLETVACAWGTYQTSRCSVLEAFLDECELEEVDRNYPTTICSNSIHFLFYYSYWG